MQGNTSFSLSLLYFCQMKVLCVHSFAVHGTASLKAILSILGTRVLPVPSLYLSGLTNIPGFIKSPVPFKALFLSSLDLARSRGDRLIIYIGYLGAAEQAEVILEGISSYREIIDHIIVDPVSGDQGRVYVPLEVLHAWPSLLKLADWAFPNFTELQLLSGVKSGVKSEVKTEEKENTEAFVEAFSNRFPDLAFVVTSLPGKQTLNLGLYYQDIQHTFQHARIDQHYGGTGDVFVAYFILYAFFEKNTYPEAMEKAALRTLTIIKHSKKRQSPDLIISPKV